MNIIWIGCDFHPSFQCVAMLDTESGEYAERKLDHASGEALRFYEGLKGRRVVMGMEACGNSGWFERKMAELGHELWLGDAGTIRSLVVRKQKTDRQRCERYTPAACRAVPHEFRAVRIFVARAGFPRFQRLP